MKKLILIATVATALTSCATVKEYGETFIDGFIHGSTQEILKKNL